MLRTDPIHFRHDPIRREANVFFPLMKTVTRLLIIVTLVTAVAGGAGPVGAQGTPASTVVDRERPAIQAVLEGLLAAQRAKDRAAMHRYVTRGTVTAWERYAKDQLLELIAKDVTQIEITWLAVDERARWAMVNVKKGLGALNLRREDGVWKVDGEENLMLGFWAGFALGGEKSPRPPARTLPPLILTDADLPFGWKTEIRDENSTFLLSRHSYVSEAIFVKLLGRRQDGTTALMADVKYHLLEDPDMATWLLWRQSKYTGATAYDFRGNSVREVSGDCTVMASDSYAAFHYLKKGRIFVTIAIDRQLVPTANMTAGKIAEKVLARLP